MSFFRKTSTDEVPATFDQLFRANLRQIYKLVALPMVLFVFFFAEQGWETIRVAWGYAETTGTVTDFGCGRGDQVKYTYAVDDVVQHGVRPNNGCRHSSTGETVRVFYSTTHPQLSVIDDKPGKILRMEVMIILLLVFVFLPVITWLVTLKERYWD